METKIKTCQAIQCSEKTRYNLNKVGYCKKHFNRAKNWGDPNLEYNPSGWLARFTPEKRAAAIQRLKENSIKRNAQKGNPHKNPQAVSIGVKKYLKENGVDAWLGENNPNWKGGPKEVGYKSDEWRSARLVALKRDNYTCADCKQYGSKKDNRLEVHHIDTDTFNHSLENLITYCMKCHHDLHNKLRGHGKYKPITL